MYTKPNRSVRKSQKQIIFITILMLIFGNISLLLEMGFVGESFTQRKLIRAGNSSEYVSIFHQYPLDIDLANIVNEVILHNKSFLYQPINPYIYHYLHSPNPCDFRHTKDERHSVLIVVKSHVLNTNQRLAIRHVWKDAHDKRVRLVFMLGAHSLEGEQWRVEKEVKLYDDIVQGNFIDSFNNLTYKLLMGLDWINSHCRQADMLLFFDDDFYVFPNEILDFLRRLPNQRNLFIGKVIKNQRVNDIRTLRKNPKFRNYMFKEIPTYVNGGSYVMSQETAKNFHTAFPYVKYFEIDDIYLGIVAQKLDIHPQQDSRFDTSNPQALAYECSHYPPRLLKGECPLAGRRRERAPVIRHVKVKPDTFWVRLYMLPQILKSAAKNVGHALYVV
ncbi:beta-1,3-galactosyltransferase 1-like [Pecten maximus]|uniref:beta-1,3-galactosyltransferase 1-like n=1 Tax=Pecten maximus TaxID=6579 RepID=UPI0014581BBD|nr:beta-1,3-galactosyltransferase 1-like [Pecten maximus]